MKTGNGSYTYDVVDRLVKAKHPFDPSTRTFALDEGGNVLTDGESTYAYNKNRITKAQPATEPEDWPSEFLGPFPAAEFRTEFSYDKHGIMVKAVMPGQGNATTSYSYDAAMHPRRTTGPDGSWVEYAYDALDRAVRRQESGGDVRLLFNDGANDQVALETNTAGVAKIRYVLDSAGRPVGQQQVGAAGLGWFVTDLRNNLTQILNASGAVKTVYAYDPFGKEKAAHSASTDGFSSRLRFQMAPVDEKTGTYNLGPRLYDPGVNRFLGADHYVGSFANMGLQLDPLTGNRYLYAGANPVGMIDDGHGWCWWGWQCWAGKLQWVVNQTTNIAAGTALGAWAGHKIVRQALDHPIFKAVAHSVQRYGRLTGGAAAALAQLVTDLLFGNARGRVLFGRAAMAAGAGVLAAALAFAACPMSAGAGCVAGVAFVAGIFTQAGASRASERMGWGRL